MRILGIIPSRYSSSRFPGKPLIDLAGKSMIRRVYEQCIKATCLTDVIVATDDARIFDHVNAFGGNAMMTSANHKTGTERCAEVLSSLNSEFDFVINIQGDEPFIQPDQIGELAAILNADTELATLVHKSDSLNHILNEHTVKAVFNQNMEALYFSREPIPHIQKETKEKWHLDGHHYLHIGIYAYRAEVLNQIVQLPPSRLEQNESLEQLRWLENGYSIKLSISQYESFGIDTPEDVQPLLDRFHN